MSGSGETNDERTDEELARQLAASRAHLSTALAEVAKTVRDMRDDLDAELRPRIERCEREIESLKQKASG